MKLRDKSFTCKEKVACPHLFAKNGDTYFTFTNLEGKSANEIQSILQLPNTPTHYGTFDTLQIANDIKVPYGNWGTADYLEPIVKDFPQFGISGYPNGGATQAITKTPINDYILKEIR